MIKDKKVEDDLEWMEQSAVPRAQARADRLALESFTSSLEALLMKEFNDGQNSGIDQKREARAHPNFLKHLEGLKRAVFVDEHYRYLAEAKIHRKDVYQTQCANRRHLP
jgi:hypothetical protein